MTDMFPSADPALRRRSRLALIVSVLLHLVTIFLLLPNMDALGPMARTPLQGPISTGRGGGGGGQGGTEMRYVAMAPVAAATTATPQPAVPPPPPPVPVLEPLPPPAPPPAPVAPPVDSVRAAAIGADSARRAGGGATAGSGPGSGGGTGGGQGTGRGTGVGGGTGPGTGGEGGTARPPEPRQLIIPPEFPPSVRGMRIAVTFWVAADGRVQRVEFEPEVPDRGYRRRLEEVMRDYRFRPARDESGRAVPGTTKVTLTF